MRLCVLVKSDTWLSKHELKKDKNNRHAKVEGEDPRGFKPYTGNYRQLRNAESGIVFLRKSTPISYPLSNGQPEHITSEKHYTN